MRKVILAVGVIAALAAVGASAAADRPIMITSTGFEPRNVTVNVGDTVTWTNADTRAHQVVVDRTCTLTIEPARTGTCAFRAAGRFEYRDPARSGGRWRGVVTVRAGGFAVTLAARPSIVTYRNATTLAGVVSNAQANERVTVQGQQCGSTTFAAVATVASSPGGAWTLAARPLKTTVYEAQWRGATARATVRVRPRLTLRKLTRGRFAVRVLAAQSFGGKIVVFQRFNRRTASWVRVRYVTTRVLGGTAPTVIAGANFRARVRVGTRVRAVIGAAQVAPCYTAGTSNVVRR